LTNFCGRIRLTSQYKKPKRLAFYFAGELIP